LNPGCNLCPIIGFIATGPGGVLAGIVVGLWVAIRRLSFRASLGALGIGSLLVALVTLALSLPDKDRSVGQLVDGTIVKCTAPLEFADEVLKEWAGSIALNPQKPVASSWREDVVRTLTESDGYVATFKVERIRDLYVGLRPWNQGSAYAGPWLEREETVRYFVSRDLCAMGGQGQRSVYLASWSVWPAEDRFPPDDASRLFSRMTGLGPIPPSYAAWASQGN
jgi:hypothetical protein